MNWCKIIGHRWKYYSENHLFKGDSILDNKVCPVPVRECRRCAVRQHHMMPRINGDCYHWNDFYHKPGAVINLEKIGYDDQDKET